MDKRFLLSAGCVFFFTLSSCSSFKNAMGAGKNPPDEFRVLTKAPLVVPPEYSLRPPRPGEPRPQEALSSEKARQALLGQGPAGRASDAEELLGAQARAQGSDPAIREILDAETGIESRSEDLSRRLLSSQQKDKKAQMEAERLKGEQAPQKATGDDKVKIDPSDTKAWKTQQNKTGKLPGL